MCGALSTAHLPVVRVMCEVVYPIRRQRLQRCVHNAPDTCRHLIQLRLVRQLATLNIISSQCHLTITASLHNRLVLHVKEEIFNFEILNNTRDLCVTQT